MLSGFEEQYCYSPITLDFKNIKYEKLYREETSRKHRVFYLIGMILSLLGWVNLLVELKYTKSFNFNNISGYLVILLIVLILFIITVILLKKVSWLYHSLCSFANLFAGHLVVYIGIKYELLISVSSFLLAVAFFAVFIIRIRIKIAAPIIVSYLFYSYIAIGLVESINDFEKSFMATGPLIISLICFIGGYILEKSSRDVFIQKRIIKSLIYNTLPKTIADRIEAGEKYIADSYKEVTILFLDIKGFTTFAKSKTPEFVLKLLNNLFTEFDIITRKFNGEKIKTIGDSYMLAFGVPEFIENQSDLAVNCGKEMIKLVKKYSEDIEEQIEVRIGIHKGEVIAGVIGKEKLLYDLWGDTVNIASRMESHGVTNSIQISEAVYKDLTSKSDIKERGVIDIKGWGEIKTWLI